MNVRTARALFTITGIVLTVCVFAMQQFPSVASAAEYEALKNVKSAKAVFDVRIGQPVSAAGHLKLILQTYKDLRQAGKKPKFVVLFSGPSVRLISGNTDGFNPPEVRVLHQIAHTVSEMSKDGIKLEICLVAVKAFHVDPSSVLPQIKKVPNGWIALIGYEAQGYSLVPAY